jgi:hypothetical protein
VGLRLENRWWAHVWWEKFTGGVRGKDINRKVRLVPYGCVPLRQTCGGARDLTGPSGCKPLLGPLHVVVFQNNIHTGPIRERQK